MKAVLGLALLCCFVVGSFGVGCPIKTCDNFRSCACKNKEAIKAKVLDGPWDFDMVGKTAAQVKYTIEMRQNYKSETNFLYLIVPKGCNWNLKLGEKYFFFGKELDEYPQHLKIGQPKGWKKLLDNATHKQKKFLRQLRDGTVVCPEVCNNAVDVMFVADTSGSIGASNFQNVLDFMAEFVQAFNIGPGQNEVQVGLVTFASQVVNRFNLDTHGTKDPLLNALSGISNATGGGTNTHLALDYVRENSFTTAAGDRPGVPNVAIVITDGNSRDFTLTKTAAENLHAANVTVFGIGVGNIDPDEIKTIASGTDDDNYYLLSDFDVLDTIQEDIEKKTCSAGSD